MNRIIDISETGARLKVRLNQLVIGLDDGAERTAPLEDLAALVISNPRVSYTNAVLSGLAAAGGILVVCDDHHAPAAMLLPLAANTLQSERMAAQVSASQPLRKRLWQSIVRAKIQAQANLLRDLRGGDGGLTELIPRVRSGDPENVESQAARRYWPLLFDDPDFRRSRDGAGPNPLLNYGYAILRAAAARALCASGLHPSISLHHHNKYDTFSLADDLMEPFRPRVDRAVVQVVGHHGRDAELNKLTKPILIESLTGQFELEGEMRTLFDVLTRASASLAACFAGKREELLLPEF